MPSSDKDEGLAQEASIRQRLSIQGYTQPYGATDDEIRGSLGISGKCADFVGYHPDLDQWLIAESKGSDLPTAEEQLENTLKGVLAKEPAAPGRIELQVYIKANQYDKLVTVGMAGYYLRSDDNFLGFFDEDDMWQYSAPLGIRISVVREGD